MFGIDDALLGGIVSGGASLLGGALGNQARAQQATSANAFSAQQFATRYQTTVKDMQAAGLNPMLAYSQGGGSPPTGQQAQQEDVLTPAVDSFNKTTQVGFAGRINSAQVENIQADSQLKRSQGIAAIAQAAASNASADQSRSNINLMEFQTKQISEELKNIPKEGDRLVALVNNLTAQKQLYEAQSKTQPWITNQLKAQILSVLQDVDLKEFDKQLQSMNLDAVKNWNNFAGNYKQVAPVIDILMQILTQRSGGGISINNYQRK